MHLGLASGIAGAVSPRYLRAEEECASLAGGVYYTQDEPGRWGKKAGSHVPMLEKVVGADGAVVLKVTTDHPQQGYRHYIVKHQLLDASYRFLGEKMFDPEKETPVSEFTLPTNYTGMVYALSMCNRHDVWLHGIRV